MPFTTPPIEDLNPPPLLRSDLRGEDAALAAAVAWPDLPPGSVVATRGAASAAHVRALFACWQRGWTVAPLSTRDPWSLTSAKLAQVHAALLLCDDPPPPQPSDQSSPSLEAAPLPCPQLPLADGGQHATVPAAAGLDPERDATIVFTSGSSGQPKAVVHSLAAMLANAAGSNRNLPLAPGDTWLLSLPLYHVGGLGILFRCALAGATIVVPPAGESLAATLARTRITHLSLVPTQLLRLLGDPAPDAPAGGASPAPAIATAPATDWRGALRAVLLGGAPIPADLVARAAALHLPLHTTYGCTEMASQITTTAPADPPAAWRSAGRLLPGRQLRIAPDAEILVRGDTLARGYLDPAGRLQPLVDAHGWYHTRDAGRLDPDGQLHVLGRLDLQFISGGENIQPEAIETALLALPGIHRACVVPRPDPEFGQRPVAFLDLAAGQPLPALPALRAALADRLPRHQHPVALHPWPAAHLSALKPDRPALTLLAAALP